MPHKKTLKIVKAQAAQFCRLKTMDDVAQLFRIDKKELTLQAFSPLYYHFAVPKANGKMRHIEAPEASLKKTQRLLNEYLQDVYYLHQSPAAYGYIPAVMGETRPKNIRTHAQRHLGCAYMLNADFEDFFHQISITDVKNIFSRAPFHFDNYTAHTLSKICCYKDRLPMGAPTSPVLSNFYTLALDNELTLYANARDSVYTRFVDDLSFSSQQPFDNNFFSEVQEMAEKCGLMFNLGKTKYYGPHDDKVITGLVLRETVDIVDDFYQELEKDLYRLQAVNEVAFITGKGGNPPMLTTFKQEIMGKIAFIAQIEGKNSPEYLRYYDKYFDAENPPEELSMRWMKFGNYLT